MSDYKNEEISTGEVDGLPITDVQSLSVFIKTNFPRCIPIPLVEGTKAPWKGFEYKDENVTDEYLWQKWNNVGSSLVENGDADVALCLRDDIIVVDVDNREHADYFMNVDCFKSTVSVRTQKGAHFYFKKTPECAHWKTKTRPFEVNGVKQDIDIKSNYDNGTGSLITIPPSTDKEWINPFGRYEVQPMPSTFVEWSNGAMDEVPRPKTDRVIKDDVKFDRLEMAVMGLSTQRATDNENWTRVCWAIYNVACENGFEEQGEDLIHEFSKKFPTKYSRRTVDRFIRYASYREKGYTMGTIMSMLKKDNPEVFKSLAPLTNQPFKGYAFVEDDDDTTNVQCEMNYNQTHNLEAPSKNYNKNISDEYKFAKKLVELLDKNRACTYGSWIRVGWCLRNIDHRLLEDWVSFSKKSMVYKEGECEMRWDHMKQDDGALKMGTLVYWARTDNPVRFGEIKGSEKRELVRRAGNGTDYDVAKVVECIYKHQFVYAPENKRWYAFKNHRWHLAHDAIDLKKRLPSDVALAFRLTAGELLGEASVATDQDEKDKLDEHAARIMKVVSKLKKSAVQSTVIIQCAMLFAEVGFEDKLDTKINLIGLKNGVYDLENEEFREGQPDDLISFTRGHNYVKQNPETRAKILKFVYSISPNKEVGDYIFTTQAYNLSGNKYLETTWIWCGIGRSGKGTLRDLIMTSSGDYYIEPKIQILTQIKKDSSSCSGDIRDMKGKRDCFLLEPDDATEKIRISIFKMMIGQDQMRARGLYEKDVSFKLQCCPQIQCNSQLGISKYENNLRSKINIIDFPYEHNTNPTMDYHRPIDTTLKATFMNDSSYAEEWFNILLDYYYTNGLNENKTISTPIEVQDATNKYFKDNNPFGVWLSERFVIEPRNIDIRIGNTDMLVYWNLDNPDSKMTSQSFGKEMGANGYKAAAINGKRYYVGFRRNTDKDNEEMEATLKVEQERKKALTSSLFSDQLD
jgi:phage/plasmid-associated DNA primase